jgi:ABC-type transport system involved in cytochrome bd biosynthesis fused ATPase/permease subunit
MDDFILKTCERIDAIENKFLRRLSEAVFAITVFCTINIGGSAAFFLIAWIVYGIILAFSKFFWPLTILCIVVFSIWGKRYFKWLDETR